ncbi:MAG: hypothetical protein D6714_00575 [Bacteroidetes bacterium]|nr:MAG: hypothetical protein D6714_00575 [Bacteroidota bacterium]
MWILKFIRFPNLLIVALTQYLLCFLLLRPWFHQHHIATSLDGFHFFLLVLTTVLIAAAGYVINDLFDYSADTWNKPDQVFIHKKITPDGARKLYAGLVATGGAIAIYLALHVGQFPLFFIYPVAVGLLWLYSRHFKKGILVGNIIVSLFCAFVAGIVLFAEREAFFELWKSDPDAARWIWTIFGGYLAFAFYSTLFREIIKDLEDMEGDQRQHCRTLPIVFGMTAAKRVGLFTGAFLWVLVAIFGLFLWQKGKLAGLAFTIAGLLSPLSYALFRLPRTNEKTGFHRLSQLAKYIMLAGLVLLLILAF